MHDHIHHEYSLNYGPVKHGKKCGCISCLLIHQPDRFIFDTEPEPM